MKIKISEIKIKSQKLSDFKSHEWENVHPEHFGTTLNNLLWKKQKFIFKATSNNKIIGVIQGDYLAGVMFIDQLIVKSDLRGKGIGRSLLEKAEKLAQQNKLHKIYLMTGVGWQAVFYYEKLGYKKESIVKNFYEKKDFWIMTKDLKKEK